MTRALGVILLFVYHIQNVCPQTLPFLYNTSTSQNTSCSNTSTNGELCFSETELLQTTLEESSVGTEDSTPAMTSEAPVANTTLPNATTSVQPNNTNPSNSTAVESTTKLPDVTSPAYGTTVGLNELQPISEDVCTCDLLMNECDINCCCDRDCSESDRFVFSSCFHKPVDPVDPNYCYRTHFIYHNNTEFKMIWTQNGMFCILQNNLPTSVQYRNRETISSIKELNQLMKTKKTYFWPPPRNQKLNFTAARSHKAGETVWVLQDAIIYPMSLPTKLLGGLCQAKRTIEYLHDWQSSCVQTIATSMDCEEQGSLQAASFYKNLTFVSTSPSFNTTLHTFTAEDCSSNTCVPVTALLCSESSTLDQCEETSDFPPPAFVADSSTCLNVVSRVRYIIRHNGTRGITNVTAYITLSQVSMLSVLQFTQRFEVEYVWASAVQHPLKRSGRPGYIVGKPVLAGRKITKISKEENVIAKNAIELSYNPQRWLSLPASKASGVCDLLSRSSVTFGENRRSICQLPLYQSNFTSNANCASLQNHILALLAGDAIVNSSETKQFNLYVAAFGDSAVERIGDWVQVKLESLASPAPKSETKRGNRALVCHGLVSSMHIDVVFAYIGSLVNPQAKILGVAFRLGPPQDLIFNCGPVQCVGTNNTMMQNFPLLSSVSFVDVTKPAVTHFAEPPVYEVKLPHDFFYPFFSRSSSLGSSFGSVVAAFVFASCFINRYSV